MNTGLGKTTSIKKRRGRGIKKDHDSIIPQGAEEEEALDRRRRMENKDST